MKTDALLQQELQHPWRLLHVRTAPFPCRASGIGVVSDHMVEIGHRALETVLNTVPFHEAIVRHPHRPAGARRCSSDQAGLLEDEGCLTQRSCDKGRTHRSAATAYDDEIECFRSSV